MTSRNAGVQRSGPLCPSHTATERQRSGTAPGVLGTHPASGDAGEDSPGGALQPLTGPRHVAEPRSPF